MTRFRSLVLFLLLAAGTAHADVRPRMLLQVGHTSNTGVAVVGYTRSGRELITCGQDGVRVWRVSDRALIDFRPAGEGRSCEAALSADRRKLLVCTYHQGAYVYENCELLLTDPLTGRVFQSRFVSHLYACGPGFLSGRPVVVDHRDPRGVMVWSMSGPPNRLAIAVAKNDEISIGDRCGALLLVRWHTNRTRPELRICRPFVSRRIRVFQLGGVEPSWAFVFHPMLPIAATANARGGVAELNLQTGRLVRFAGSILSRSEIVEYAAGGTTIVSAGTIGQNQVCALEIWRRSDRKRIAECHDLTVQEMFGLDVSPDAKSCAIVDRTVVHFRGLPGGRPLGDLPLPAIAPVWLECSADARTAVTVWGHLWDVPHARRLPFQKPTYLEDEQCSISPDGHYLAFSVYAWHELPPVIVDLRTNAELWRGTTTPDRGYMGAFSPDSKTLVLGLHPPPWGIGGSPAEVPQARVYETATGKAIKELGSTRYTSLSSARFTPNGNLLVLPGVEQPTRIYDGHTFELLREIPLPEKEEFRDAPFTNHFAVNNELIAMKTDGNHVHVWSLLTGRHLRQWYVALAPTSGVYLDRTGRYVIVSGDVCLKMLHISDGREVAPDMREVRRVVDDSAGPDRRLGLVVGRNRTMSSVSGITYRDNNTGQTIVTACVLPGKPNGAVEWIAYTPDGYYQGSPGVEKWIRWRVGEGVLPGAALAARFRRPDVIAKRIARLLD